MSSFSSIDSNPLPIQTLTIQTLEAELQKERAARTRAEETLGKTLNVLHALLEGTSDVIYIKDLQGRYSMINSAGARFMGSSVEDIVGHFDHEFFTPETSLRITEDDRKVAQTGEIRSYEAYADKPGSSHVFHSTKGPFRDNHGNVIGIIGISKELTERKNTEKSLIFRSRQLEILSKATQQINAVLEIPAIMQTLVRSAIELVSASSGAWGQKVDEQVIFTEHIFEDKIEPIYWISRIGEDTEINGSFPGESRVFGRNRVHVPISKRNGVLIGCFELYDKEGKAYFDQADITMLSALATSAAVALENAQMMIELRNAENFAKEALSARDEFLSIASHELRTPLTALSLGLEHLKNLATMRRLNQYPGDKVLHLLKIANDQNHRLIGLVNDLLDVACISSGRLTIRTESVNFSALLNKVVSELTGSLAAAGCRIEFRLEEGIIGEWDQFRIEQVVINLLTNAMKYAAGSQIQITTSKSETHAKLLVHDQGIGISQENLPKIFNRYERAVSARHFGGVGLGLYIVRQILERHGGTIEVQSELGKGSVFTIELPLSSPA